MQLKVCTSCIRDEDSNLNKSTHNMKITLLRNLRIKVLNKHIVVDSLFCSLQTYIKKTQNNGQIVFFTIIIYIE